MLSPAWSLPIWVSSDSGDGSVSDVGAAGLDTPRVARATGSGFGARACTFAAAAGFFAAAFAAAASSAAVAAASAADFDSAAAAAASPRWDAVFPPDCRPVAVRSHFTFTRRNLAPLISVDALLRFCCLAGRPFVLDRGRAPLFLLCVL